MSIFTKPTGSLEAIDFQKKSMLFAELTNQFQELIEINPTQPRAIEKSGLAKIITHYTGIPVDVTLDPNPKPNAWAAPPILTKNHPLLKNAYRALYDEKQAVKLVDNAEGLLQGTVDLRNSKVYGIFTKIDCKLGISVGCFNAKMAADEMAAIMLHEIGHLFTYFEYAANMIRLNYVLNTATKAILETGDKVRRIEILENVEKAARAPIFDKKALAESENKETYEAIIISANREELRSELGSDIYDDRGWERLADQFAARHGAALPLATGLSKIWGRGDRSYMSTPKFLMMETLKTIWFLTAMVIFPAVALILFLTIPPLDDTYDRPKERLMSLKKQVVEALKDQSNDKDRQLSLLQDVKALDDAMAAMKDRDTVFFQVWRILSPNIRKQANQVKDQKVLEDLINNNLFVSAAQLANFKPITV